MSKLQKLPANFYKNNSFLLAEKLLGKFLIRKYNNHTLVGKITETECYYGHDDLASHASRGKTERTKLMFDQPGLAYIYLVYGMYYCFNIVSEAKDFPAAILIRSIEPISGLKQMAKNRQLQPDSLNSNIKLTTGPGKLCQAFKIDKKLNGENLIKSERIYLAKNPQEKISKTQIATGKRIGIDYAGKYKNKLWRYYLKNNQYISQ
ncbi:DNA-3-methyladenine glycosylase [Patescibacteria group bacterium]